MTASGDFCARWDPFSTQGYLAFSPDGRWLACGVGLICLIWDLENLGSNPHRIEDVGEIIHFSGDSRWLATTGRQFHLWSTGTWQPSPPLPLETQHANSFAAAFSNDGRYLAAAQRDNEIHLVDLTTRETVAILEAPSEGRVWSIDFSPDGNSLAATRDRGEVQLWDLPSLRKELAKLALDW